MRALMRPARRPIAHTAGEASTLKADLTKATTLGQFELVYQPVVDLARDEILGWEALVRWQHPERGLVLPAEFIPPAEDTGDILAIGEWVLDRACADFAQVLGCSAQPASWVSVNISARQLLERDFADTVRQSLDRWKLDPGSLVLEITESALIAETARAAEVLASLRRDGVRIALDDFGTGFASLRYLQQLPIDIIKIDRYFVSMAGDAPSGTFDAIVQWADSLGLETIAEGIEESEELERVRRFDHVAGQGYYFARPMDLAKTRTFTLKSTTAR